MTGLDFQVKLDAIVRDLQTSGKGQNVSIMFRDVHNAPTSLPLSSLPDGTVNAAELKAVQSAVDALKNAADAYAAVYAPVQFASDALKTASMPYDMDVKAIADARYALSQKQLSDSAYQQAKLNYTSAKTDPSFIVASTAYSQQNVSENYSELVSARSKYVTSNRPAPSASGVSPASLKG